MQFVLVLAFLRSQGSILVLLHAELVVEARDVSVAVGNDGSLAVQLTVQIGILLLAFVVDAALFVDLASESLNEPNVAVDAALVVFVHPALLLVQSRKTLLQIEQLVLHSAVVTLLRSKVVSLLHQLSD